MISESEILGFFVQFRVIYIKEFTGQKKVTNKLPYKSAKMA